VIPLLAILVALACAAASARRVWFAANATALHPAEIHEALKAGKGPEAIESLRALVANDPAADWERDLLEALAAPAAQRAALVNEQLTELDYRIQRWSRVPRVCASIATSAGFMLATLVLRRGLADSSEDMPVEVAQKIVSSLMGDALTVGVMGMVGTAFCIGALTEARRIAKAHAAAADRLVERLEELVSPAPEAPLAP